MARIRSIKPEFPQSESMGRVSRDARLLFVLLWTFSDDEGKFRAHPRLLAAELFPYDDDALQLLPAWLDELVREDCVLVYRSGRDTYGQIVKWRDHQKVDHPSRSRIPDPPVSDSREFSRDPREVLASPRETLAPDHGRDHGEDHGSDRADGARESAGADLSELQTAWNDTTTAPLPRWSQTPKPRRKAALNALKRRPLEEWRAVFRRVEASPFCRGSTGWVADIDWALRPDGKKPETATLVLEGKYDDRATGPPAIALVKPKSDTEWGVNEWGQPVVEAGAT